MTRFKVTTVGALADFTLTKEVMARLKIKKGDNICLTQALTGISLDAL